ncbi:hypothetical protein BJY21_003267 [Kineosphaera limosa]|uniref:Uncharacterized protein n=1 Tax=Kineosphaera limosa NBRC 100340 TaxID=1184609 RepID=K6W819_9MICO|nr:hypothetical protein [Kineosphaera limosa]NYE02083.1 hypothetical protein [Kineosphaera limosa]GAB95315.1 hypothetical protein KILIM_018_00630 [Kineosphaera limosa NBRC 100340]
MTLQIDITDSLLQTAADAPAELLWACPVELRKPVLRILDTLSSRGSDVDVALAGGRVTLFADSTGLTLSEAMTMYAMWTRAGHTWWGYAPDLTVTSHGFSLHGGRFDLEQDADGTTVVLQLV